MIKLFVILQVLDLATTLIGLRLGLQEASPMVRLMLKAGPVAGVLLAKMVAFALLGVCVWRSKLRVIKWANWWFSALFLWNSLLIYLQLRMRMLG